MSIRNPYRRRSEASAALDYTLHGESKTIRGDRYRSYQVIFNQLSVDGRHITDVVAMHTLEISSLPPDELEKLYDYVTAQRLIQLGPACPKSEEVLRREEFFVLLSELQTKLGLDHIAFRAKFCPNQEPPRPRRNPFSKDSTNPPLPQSIQSSPSSTRSSFWKDDDKEVIAFASLIGTDKTSSVYSEKEVLASTNPELSSKDEALNTQRGSIVKKLPGSPPQKILAPVLEATAEWTCPTCTFTNSSNCTHCSICVSGLPAPRSRMGLGAVAVVPQANMRRPPRAEHQQTTVDERGTSVRPSARLIIKKEDRSGIEPVTQEVVQLATAAATQDGKISVIHETESKKAEALRLARSLLPDLYQQSKKRSGFKISRESIPGAPSGYLFRDLASLFVSAAIEGNIHLLAALVERGADINYSNPKKLENHNAIQQAVEAKQETVIDYLLAKGTNKASATLALSSAIKLDLVHAAMKLVSHADLTLYMETTFNGFDSKLFHVYETCEAMAAKMKSTERMDLLCLMFKQTPFRPEKGVIKAIKQGKKRSQEITRIVTMLDLLSYLGDREGVDALLNLLGERYRILKSNDDGAPTQFLDPLCYLQARNWKSHPRDMLKIAQLLVKHGAQPRTTVELPIGPEMSPVASAVVGGSLQGVMLLLGHRANPECAIDITMTRKLTIGSLVGVAAAEGFIDICRALVESGVVPWQIDKYGHNPLYYTCCGGSLVVVQYFLSLDTARSDISGCLDVAIRDDNLEVIRALVGSGARVTHSTWLVVMAKNPAPQDRAQYFQLIDALLHSKCSLYPELVLVAIDRRNYAGLSRLLQKRNGVLDFEKNAIFSDGPKDRLSLLSSTPSSATGAYGFHLPNDRLVTRLSLSDCTSSSTAKNSRTIANAFESRPVSRLSEGLFSHSHIWSWNIDRYNCVDYVTKEKAADVEKLLRTWGWMESTNEERLRHWLDADLCSINHKQRRHNYNSAAWWENPPQLPPDLPLAAPHSP